MFLQAFFVVRSGCHQNLLDWSYQCLRQRRIHRIGHLWRKGVGRQSHQNTRAPREHRNSQNLHGRESRVCCRIYYLRELHNIGRDWPLVESSDLLQAPKHFRRCLHHWDLCSGKSTSAARQYTFPSASEGNEWETESGVNLGMSWKYSEEVDTLVGREMPGARKMT